MAALLDLPVEVIELILITLLFGDTSNTHDPSLIPTPFVPANNSIFSTSRRLHREAWAVVSRYACLRLKFIDHHDLYIDYYEAAGFLAYTNNVVIPPKVARKKKNQSKAKKRKQRETQKQLQHAFSERRTYTETLRKWRCLQFVRYFVVEISLGRHYESHKTPSYFHMYKCVRDCIQLFDSPNTEKAMLDIRFEQQGGLHLLRRATFGLPNRFDMTVHVVSNITGAEYDRFVDGYGLDRLIYNLTPRH